MKLHKLNKQTNFHKSKKIVGRGPGSGKGMHTVGRGMNGQRSRSGGNKNPRVDFAGGQNPLSRQLPKLRGFKALSSKLIVLNVNLSDLNKFKDGDKVNPQTLEDLGILNSSKSKNTTQVKILGTGKVERKSLTFSDVNFSKSAKVSLENVGAKFE